MSRINMRTGITAEQVNEAADAMNAYRAALDNTADGEIDTSVIAHAIELMNEAAYKLSSTLGNEHMASRRVSDASIRAQEAMEKAMKANEKNDVRKEKLYLKVRSYDGWFVIVDDKRVPVTDVRTVDGLVACGGEYHPFIPVYYPAPDADKALMSLFDQD